MPGFLGITSIAMIHHGKSSKIQGVDVLRACHYTPFREFFHIVRIS